MAGWTRPDRHPERGSWWFAADAALTLVFVWITVVSLRSDAYVDQYGPIEGAGAWTLALGPTLLLAVRRLAPATALVVATALYLAASATQGDSNAPLAVPFFAYSVGMTRPVSTSGPMVALAALAASTTVLYGPGDPDPLLVVVWWMLFGIGWLVAVSIRRNQFRADLLTRRAERLEAQRDQVAQTAIAEERARIARELHDAVGHAVNVIVLHAGAARLSGRPEQARATLANIEQLGRTALTDLDHMLGLLHEPPDTDPSRAPAHGIADLDALVEDLRATGIDIELAISCEGALHHRTQSAAYRIIQEALTNVVKHAEATHVVVTLSCTEREVRLCVADDGVGAAADRPDEGGRGVPGMTERAKVLGGRLSAGPVDGGYLVEAVLPRVARDTAPERPSEVSSP